VLRVILQDYRQPPKQPVTAFTSWPGARRAAFEREFLL